MTEKAMFEDAQVGDRVWDFRYGFGEIATVDPSNNYPLKVKFPCANGAMTYTLDGKHYSNEAFLSLFWDEIKFDIPPRPKRKVKKEVEFWMNFYSDRSRGGPHDNEYLADACAASNRIGHAVRFTHTLEVDG
jgi:hypothetical protein